MMKRKDNTSTKKKVTLMTEKERMAVRSNMKDIKTFFMKLTKDPKLELENKTDNTLLCEGEDGVSCGGEKKILRPDVGTNLCGRELEVSLCKNIPNMYGVQTNCVPGICVGDDDSVSRGHDAAQFGRIQSRGDAGGDRVQCEGDDGNKLYSFVQGVSDEKMNCTQRWTMKTGKLTRSVIDQNQTTVSAKSGGSNRRLERTNTHQSKILLWEGRIQSGKVAEYSTESARQSRLQGQTEHSRTSEAT